jgi:hypothetical protein
LLHIEETSNAYRRAVRLTFGLRAVAADGSSVVKTVSVGQAGSAAKATTTPTQPTPPVANLDACRPSPHCFYGPIYDTYPDYGNVAPTGLGDCTFAAVADWEQIVLGLHPDPSLIGFQFGQAGGTVNGLSAGALFGYWQQAGINNVPLAGVHALSRAQADVESGVRTYKALLVAFEFADGDGFGQYTVSAGGHMGVVDGFTPEGPLVVSWGQTLQLTWDQWNAEVTNVWAVADSPTSPAGPGLVLTPPAPGASYQLKACWTQYTGNSWTNENTSSATTSYSGSDLLSRGPDNFWTIISLVNAPTATISGTQVSLIEPNGRVFYTETLGDWATTYNQRAVNFHWYFGNGALFFQYPWLTGQGTWSFEWQFPDGQTCFTSFVMS